MKKMLLTDVTLKEISKNSEFSLSFKENVEIVKLLNKINIDIIELPMIKNKTADTLLVKTIATVVKGSVLSIPTELSVDGIDTAWNAVKEANCARIQIGVPTSTVQMEYICRKKPKAVLEMITTLVSKAKTYTKDVEFVAEDATRSDYDFLCSAIKNAVAAGATTVTLSDTAGCMMANEFAEFVARVVSGAEIGENINIGVQCSNDMDMAVATAVSAFEKGATEIKVMSTGNNITSLSSLIRVMRVRGTELEIGANVKITEAQRVISQIDRIAHKKQDKKNDIGITDDVTDFVLNVHDDISEVTKAIFKLGYDLSEEDCNNVYNEFKNIANKKTVGAKELDTIIASVALQVPSTYVLDSYVINSGNIITATANLKITKNGEEMRGIGSGDGPIDAAFQAVEQVIGHHYELDDFQIQSVTEGREAMGYALVKLRSNGKLYAGKGISTDIIGASIRAYINALNKIVYEEA